MNRDAQETRKRLLDAAVSEFAERGIAGARVDRIADRAGCSKALMYSYFGNKDDLFDAVYDALVVTHVQEVPIDVSDLASYAGRLFDQYQQNPQIVRLSVWDRLERNGAGMRLSALVAVNAQKTAAIEQAQREGIVSKSFRADELLALITSISTMWLFLTPDAGEVSDEMIRAQRQTVTHAVAALLGDPAETRDEASQPLRLDAPRQ